MAEHYCSIHQTPMLYKKGVSKAGKNYEGYFCQGVNEDGTRCDQVSWVDSRPKPARRGQNRSNIAPKGEDYQNLLAANRKLYSLILAIAHLQGIKSEDIDNELKRMEYLGK